MGILGDIIIWGSLTIATAAKLYSDTYPAQLMSREITVWVASYNTNRELIRSVILESIYRSVERL